MMQVTASTSVKNAHEHLVKHVLRLSGRPAQDKEDDLEHWSSLITDAPLAANLPRRRADALAVFHAAPCGVKEPAPESPCGSCSDHLAIGRVSKALHPLLEAYVAVAREAVHEAFVHPDKKGPRLVAYHEGGHTLVDAIDSRHVRVVGRLASVGEGAGKELELITCYRDRGRSLRSHSLELGRRRAAHKRRNTLVDLGGEHVDL